MNTSRLDLNLLKVFAAIYEKRTLTSAAADIGLSQPALSHALKRLRLTFEDELFVRQGNAYSPTRKAESIAEPVTRALDALSQTLTQPYRFDPDTSRRSFRLAISDFGSHTVLTPLASHLNAAALGIQCIVSQLQSDRFVHQLASGDLDIAIMSSPSTHDDILSDPIVDESLVYIARKHHPMKKALQSIEGFAAVSHLLVNLISEPRSYVDTMLEKRGLKRHIQLVVPYFSAVPGIVSNSDLIAALPHRLALQAKRDHPVVLFKAPLDIPPIQFHMHWHKRKQRDVELKWFREAVASVCARI